MTALQPPATPPRRRRTDPGHLGSPVPVVVPDPPRVPLAALAVVVPAHDEADELPACLAALVAATTAPGLGNLQVSVVVVLDGCTDASEALVQACEGVAALAVPRCGVGPARAAGVAWATSRLSAPADATWVAWTDADTHVPTDWLVRHRDLADVGWDAVAGTVDVRDLGALPAPAAAAYLAGYGDRRDGHAHVHGANLGVRLSACRGVGGVPLLARDEDVTLLAALRAAGSPVLASGELRVATSGRLQGRAPGGVADLLADLDL